MDVAMLDTTNTDCTLIPVVLAAAEMAALGDYALAEAKLIEVIRVTACSTDISRRIASSLALSVRASLLRQQGNHQRAAHYDGRAVREVSLCVGSRTGSDSDVSRISSNSSDNRELWATVAWCDALTGLAADHLGMGSFVSSQKILARVNSEVQQLAGTFGEGDWWTSFRVQLRLLWVTAEWGMYTGDSGCALEAAQQALVLLAHIPSERHRLKTELIACAAMAVGGNSPEVSLVEALRIVERCAEAKLLPLQWAALQLADGLSGDPENSIQLARIKWELFLRGGRFR